MECYICKNEIRGQYFIDAYKHCVCAEHIHDSKIVQCFSCGAFTFNTSDHLIHDGRVLCNSCRSQVVSTTEHVERIKKQVLYLLADEGVVFCDKKLEKTPIHIVTAQEIANLRHSPISLANKGVTITQTISSLLGMAVGKAPKMSHKVYILDNLIKTEFAATLAHEFMHIWQNENNIKLNASLCEGLCNLGSWFSYKKIATTATPYLIKSLAENPDSIYGDGFRYVFNRYNELGTERLIELALNGKL